MCEVHLILLHFSTLLRILLYGLVTEKQADGEEEKGGGADILSDTDVNVCNGTVCYIVGPKMC